MIKKTSRISIDDYTYQLPDDRIAYFPLEIRDESKLLQYKNGQITEKKFKELADAIKPGSKFVFNNTKVIRARLKFKKETGAQIEIFVLEPLSPTKEIQQAFQTKGFSVWKCFIGNAKKWKSEDLTLRFEQQGIEYELRAEKLEAVGNAFHVRFSWSPEYLSFASIIEKTGNIPLPPYIHREVKESDAERYQTVYAQHDGSVAAPTAGLHFTKNVFDQLEAKDVTTNYVTLHVGAGTFKPVESGTIGEHEMHSEQVVISKNTILDLIEHRGGPIIAVGTTTVRSLESLYWYGVKLIVDQAPYTHLFIEQWDPYQERYNCGISKKKALLAIVDMLEKNDKDYIYGNTQLLIAPGYQYRIVEGMVTNFHQPQSTLLLLVAAFIGEDWKRVYDYALNHDFRFLSYGDSCLFLKD
ncbi:MAG: S-adenosylmethionine:tRNA ribosyltransferase-isomerase [Bacteroidales bacterium]|nr:S-adenosylmethionine:tRNA ribosyltransferase-isomerase [Bacteroidales bacterium]